jgi:glycosyltransferase involved in cell wall biosynthesis
MFDTGAVFIAEWIAAARQVAEVIRLGAVTAEAAREDPRLIAVDGVRGLYRHASELRSYSYSVPWMPPYRGFGQFADAPNVRALVRVIRGIAEVEGPLDLLHGHFYANARPLPTVSRRLDLPYVVTEHSSALTQQSPDQTVSNVGRRIAGRVYAHAEYVLVVSRALLESIEGLGLRGRFVIVNNPVDTSAFGLAVGYTGGPFRVVCTARLDPVKRLDVLLHAAALLFARGVDLQMTIFGDGSERETLVSIARDLGLIHRVLFAGLRPRHEIFEALAQAHAFSLVSSIETQSLGIIEALCTGLPVIATAVGGIPEIVGAADGILVAPGDASAVADALEAVTRGTRRFTAAAIANRARDRFSSQAIAGRLAEIYTKACTRPPHSSNLDGR